MSDWSDWRPFPDPRASGYLVAPIGPGVYELRNRATTEYVLVGISSAVAYRMLSLLPKPYGRGTRNNARKREYVLQNIAVIDYRTLACSTRDDAACVETASLRSDRRYLFPT